MLFRYLVFGLQEPKMAKELKRPEYPIAAGVCFLKVLELILEHLDILTHTNKADMMS